MREGESTSNQTTQRGGVDMTAKRKALAFSVASIGALCGTLVLLWPSRPTYAQAPIPTLVDQNLGVRTVVGNLTTPTTMAFLGNGDFFVLEKNTGQVKRVTNGVANTVLDLAVNFASERGLLGIALHPNFPTTPFVYLYWTSSVPAPTTDLFTPTQTECADLPVLGGDTNTTLAVPLLGNRVDRFTWNGSTLLFDRNLIKLHSFQND